MRKAIFAGLLVVLVAGFAQADPATDITKASSKISDGADVLSMGNANTALTSDYSVRNPGGVDAIDAEPRNKFGAAATYGNISFKNGPSINLYTISAMTRFPIGTLQISYADGGSNKGTLDGFDDTLKFNSFPSIDTQYGLKVGSGLLRKDDELYAGIGYEYSESKLTSGQAANLSQGVPAFNVVSRTSSNTLELGALYRIAAKKVNIGWMYLHSWDTSNDSMGDNTHSQSDQLRLGVSVKVTPLTLISFDYRHLYLPGASDDQYNAGIEQYLIKDVLALYAGCADGGVTGGIGIYTKYGGINFGYMHGGMNSLKKEFGASNTLMVSIYGNL